MKNSIVNAVLISLGVFVVGSLAGALFVASMLNNDNIPAFGANRAVWDQFLFTPLLFAITGGIFGWVAAKNATLKATLTPALVTALVVALIIDFGTRVLMLSLRDSLRQQDTFINSNDLAGRDLGMIIAAAVLWVAWFVAGSAVGHIIRNRNASKATGE
ncbi:MAG TPA: hypothetical protein VGK19_09625 [Capsulimonadaceae bacterium]|jgi:hypothetical protein